MVAFTPSELTRISLRLWSTPKVNGLLWLAPVMVACLAIVSGCASLKVRQGDSVIAAVGKVSLRVPLAVISAGRSEQWFALERNMESWLGKRADSLVFVWGRPTETIPDGIGGGMLVYSEQRSILHSGQSNSTTTASADGRVFPNGYFSASGVTQTTTTYTPAWIERYAVFRAFRVNSDGIINAYRWQGM